MLDYLPRICNPTVEILICEDINSTEQENTRNFKTVHEHNITKTIESHQRLTFCSMLCSVLLTNVFFFLFFFCFFLFLLTITCMYM